MTLGFEKGRGCRKLVVEFKRQVSQSRLPVFVFPPNGGRSNRRRHGWAWLLGHPRLEMGADATGAPGSKACVGLGTHMLAT